MRILTLLLMFLVSSPVSAKTVPQSNPDKAIDRIFESERALATTLRNYSPMVETYLQRMQPNAALGYVPSEDRYFLGRVQFEQSNEEFYLDKRLVARMAGAFSKFYSLSPVGFSSMILVDRTGFDRRNYHLRYMQREFLGEVRCLVFEVTPTKNNRVASRA
jgi:hypothetical protein